MAIRFSYTQEQLDAAVLAERHRCADICEGLRVSFVDAFGGQYKNDFIDGYIDAFEECRWAILQVPE